MRIWKSGKLVATGTKALQIIQNSPYPNHYICEFTNGEKMDGEFYLMNYDVTGFTKQEDSLTETDR